ncbi:hypothetical protein NDU88_000185 [Pleurodeles waltl]|uniref:Uncharacterized protein n=1 Tax=Pleurodeles waltl TaxID=8319 RepID=A0AAV7P053_PLEWA|nr:hypothetical protein NDU88_000185 [Pleurodeles waltl]
MADVQPFDLDYQEYYEDGPGAAFKDHLVAALDQSDQQSVDRALAKAHRPFSGQLMRYTQCQKIKCVVIAQNIKGYQRTGPGELRWKE